MKFLKSTLSLLVLSCLLMAGIAQADEDQPEPQMANLFEVLSQRGIRSSLHGKDLTASWRMLRVSANPESDALLREMSGRRRDETPWDDFYYTRGDIITMTGQNYLVAYRLMPPSDPNERARQEQFARAWQNSREKKDLNSEFPPIEEKSELTLSLISIGANTNFNDIRAFDPGKDLLTAAVKAKRHTQIERVISQSNLKQVSLGMMQYVQDYDELLPPMRAARSATEFTSANSNDITPATPVQVRLMPYVKNTQIFLHPGTRRPYLPNYKISRMGLYELEDTARIFMFFEDAPDSEGKRNVAFLDGHVEALSEAEFQSRRKAQGISESGLPLAAPKVKQKAKAKPPTIRGSGPGKSIRIPSPPPPIYDDASNIATP